MIEFLEKTLRQSVTMKQIEYLYDELPLAFRGKYILYKVETNGMPWVAICPKADVSLTMLRKDRAKIEQQAGLNCAIFFNTTSYYIKEKLIEEGIPFVIKYKQVYLPFLGYLLSNDNKKIIEPVHLISFLTQKLILIAIYEKWDEVTVSQAANKLNVSKMSISRCFDEIEYLNVDILVMKGKSRVITVPNDVKNLWHTLQKVLRNPVLTRFELIENVNFKTKAGISALCEYSLLSDNDFPTYAITKKEIADTEIKKMKQAQSVDEIKCVVLELGYFIDFKNSGIEDPLSVALSFTEEEMEEDRIAISIKNMLEEYVW